MGGKRDWLVLSLKWSQAAPRPEWLVWYQTNDSGYTSNLLRAGRYTEDEARRRDDGENTLAVPLDAAIGLAENLCVVEAASVNVEVLQAASREAEAAS